MAKKSKVDAAPELTPPEEVIKLHLYVAGQSPKSVAAISNLKRICAEYLTAPYNVEVIDLVKNPELARDHQILAIPTLVRSRPGPMRKIIGDLSDTEQVVADLDIRGSKPKRKAAGA